MLRLVKDVIMISSLLSFTDPGRLGSRLKLHQRPSHYEIMGLRAALGPGPVTGPGGTGPTCRGNAIQNLRVRVFSAVWTSGGFCSHGVPHAQRISTKIKK